MKENIKKTLRQSFMLGITSVFFPNAIQVEPFEMPVASPAENIAGYWKNVGSYFYRAYGATKPE